MQAEFRKSFGNYLYLDSDIFEDIESIQIKTHGKSKVFTKPNSIDEKSQHITGKNHLCLKF